jgi:CPA2 family monovalent cation:H+ antiporter-2
MHDTPLISTIAVAFTAAWILGLLAQRVRLSPIVGYLLAGVVIGPFTPGFAGDLQIAQQLAEVGVILLMFGVGLHFQIKDLIAVKGVAIPGAVGQSLVATLAAVAVFSLLGLPVKTGVVIGMAMSVASTVVLMRVLMDADVMNSPQGHAAVGWLIVEDIFTIVLLVVLPMLGEGGTPGTSLWAALGVALLKLTALVALVLLVGARAVPWVLTRVARLRSRELFTLTVLVFSIAIAAGAYHFFGASMALGAFLAGTVVAQSPVSHQAAADALPMRDAFAVLFFVSVGMLFDPAFIFRAPLLVVAALGIILVVKPLTALVIVVLLGHSARTALTVALGLSQIGEFSFILSDVARRHGLMSDAGHTMLVASAIVSIAVNPMIFRALPRIEAWLRARPKLWTLLNGRAERKARKTNLAAAAALGAPTAGERIAVVVGFGPVGRSVHSLLRDAGMTTVVIDLNLDVVSGLNESGQRAIYGDASHEGILEQAGVRRASHVVLTLPHAADRATIVASVRELNPNARMLVRARYLSEREDLERAGVAAAVFEEAEAAVGLARLVLADTGVRHEAAERKVRDLRLQLIRENMANIRTQRVRSVMVPWNRVWHLSAKASRDEVLRQISQKRFSRWPVVDPETGAVQGYLLARDLIAVAAADEDWTRFVRPLRAVRPDDDVESTLLWMQGEGATVCSVEHEGSLLGLITLEDILEQVVGRIEDEYPHEAETSLLDALKAGGLVLALRGSTREAVVREMASALPPGAVSRDAAIADRALAREAELSTDLGVGVALPHARAPGLTTPRVVFGRSSEGVAFSPPPDEPVRLVFLLVTPIEQPEVQIALLGQIANVISEESARERLRRASSEGEVLEIIAQRLAMKKGV